MKKITVLIISALLTSSLVFSQQTKSSRIKIGGRTNVGSTASGGGGGCTGTLCTNLVASYSLSDLTDATGRGNTLTNNGSATFNTGKIGNAVYLNPTSTQFLSITNNADVGMGDIDFSISARVFLNTIGVNQCIIGKDDEDSNNRDYRLNVNSDNTFSFFVFHTGGSANAVTTSTTATTSTYYDVVAWHNAATDQIGIIINNGTPVTDVSGGALSATSAAKFTIGARDTAGGRQLLDGRIDGVNVWKKVLNSGEITALYNSGTGVEYPYTTP